MPKIASLFIVNTNTPTTINDIFIEGTLKGKKSMHTLSFILPNLPIDHPCASLCTSSAVLYQDNHVFTATVNTAVNAIKISWRNQLLRDAINKQHQVLSFIDHDMTILIMNHSFIAFVIFHYLQRLLLLLLILASTLSVPTQSISCDINGWDNQVIVVYIMHTNI